MSEALPSGTLTFLFTDLVDSTLLWEQQHTAEMVEAITRHERILSEAVTLHGGIVVKTQGDGLMAVFDDADAAVRAAVDGQRAMSRQTWSMPLGVRMGLCTGQARERGGDYHGPVVNRAARVAGAAHPGQILVAPTTAVLVETFQLRDLGEYQLKGLAPMRLSQVLADDVASAFPPLMVASVGVGVAPATGFIGRVQELAAIEQLVEDHQFVTLTGVGGCGKTRLAIEVSRQLLGQFADGVRFADLAVITDSSDVADAAARALGLVDDGNRHDAVTRVADHLRSRSMLCILDNCEHVIDACAELAEAVIARPGESRVIATSREPLGVPGEQVYLVPSLDARTDALSLFAARATEARPGFVLDDATIDTVTQICERLDGIPLAIELAAARVNQLSPVQLLERLADRFHLLTGGRRRVQRQHTLAAALDWSHDLLDDAEQTLLRRLAVFPASFDIEAVEVVTDVADIATLGSLVTKSLVQVVEHGERFRYRLLETVRLYASEKLVVAGEADVFRARHAQMVVDGLEAVPLEERWFADDPGPVDVSDVRAALEWSTGAGATELVARIASGVNWTRFDHWNEGVRWCESADDADDLAAGTRLQVLMMLEQLYTYTLTGRRAVQLVGLFDRAEPLADDHEGPLGAFMWTARGVTGATMSQYVAEADLATQAAEWLERGVATMDRFAVPWRVYCRLLVGMSYTTMNQPEAAERHFEAAAALGEHLEGYELLRGTVRGSLAVFSVLSGDVDRALSLSKGIVELPHAPTPYREAPLTTVVVLAAAGDVEAARRVLAACHEDAVRTGMPLGVEEVLVFGAVVAGLADDWSDACRLLAASGQGYRRSPFSYLLYRTFRDRARVAVGVDRARELREEGRAMSGDEALALALGR